MTNQALAKGDGVLTVDVVSSADMLDALADEWNELLQKSAANRVFLTWQWMSTWWNVYEPGYLWVLAIRSDDQLVGIAPWYKDMGSNGTTIRCIGGEDVTDYQDIIVDRNCEAAVFETLATFLAENQDQFDSISLPNFPEGSPVLDAFVNALNDAGLTAEAEQMEVCPIIPLGDSFADYLSSLDKKQRHEMRRKIRRANGADVEWYTVGEEHDLAEQLEIFLNLMRTASQDKVEFLQNEDHVTFFNQFADVAYEQGWLELSILTFNGEPSAGYINFVYGDEVGVYNSGLNAEVGGHLSPGIVLLAHLINKAIDDGYKSFNMLRGDEEYKYRIGAEDTNLYRLTVKY